MFLSYQIPKKKKVDTLKKLIVGLERAFYTVVYKINSTEIKLLQTYVTPLCTAMYR
jgi:hypothetical protein